LGGKRAQPAAESTSKKQQSHRMKATHRNGSSHVAPHSPVPKSVQRCKLPQWKKNHSTMSTMAGTPSNQPMKYFPIISSSD
jgi:hypothetical protein